MSVLYELFAEIVKRLTAIGVHLSLSPSTLSMWWVLSVLVAAVLTCLPFILLGLLIWFLVEKRFPRFAVKINLLKQADKILMFVWFQYFLILLLDIFVKFFNKELA